MAFGMAKPTVWPENEATRKWLEKAKKLNRKRIKDRKQAVKSKTESTP